MMMAVAMLLPREGRRWGDWDNGDGKEGVMEVRWTTTTRPSRRQEVAAGKRAGSRSPQGGQRMGAVTTKSAKTHGGNYDGGSNDVVLQKPVRWRWWRWTATTRQLQCPPLLLLVLLTLPLLGGSTRPVPPRCHRWVGGTHGGGGDDD